MGIINEERLSSITPPFVPRIKKKVLSCDFSAAGTETTGNASFPEMKGDPNNKAFAGNGKGFVRMAPVSGEEQ